MCDSAMTLWYVVVIIWFHASEHLGAKIYPRQFAAMQFFAAIFAVLIRVVTVYVTAVWLRIVGMDLRFTLQHLERNCRAFLVDIGKWALLPGLAGGTVIGGLWVDALLRNKTRADGQSQINLYIVFGLFILANVVMVSLTIAVVVKSIRHFRLNPDQRQIKEMQLMVILVAASYCVANFPSAVVYYFRASSDCFSDVPSGWKTAQAAAHVFNSGSNFFLYLLASPGFRRNFLGAVNCRRCRQNLRETLVEETEREKSRSGLSNTESAL